MEKGLKISKSSIHAAVLFTVVLMTVLLSKSYYFGVANRSFYQYVYYAVVASIIIIYELSPTRRLLDPCIIQVSHHEPAWANLHQFPTFSIEPNTENCIRRTMKNSASVIREVVYNGSIRRRCCKKRKHTEGNVYK